MELKTEKCFSFTRNVGAVPKNGSGFRKNSDLAKFPAAASISQHCHVKDGIFAFSGKIIKKLMSTMYCSGQEWYNVLITQLVGPVGGQATGGAGSTPRATASSSSGASSSS